jgi:hypothetical protein
MVRGVADRANKRKREDSWIWVDEPGGRGRVHDRHDPPGGGRGPTCRTG